jgi:hypothetical protein
MAVAAPLAVGLSLASTGFAAAGQMAQGKGQQAAANYEAGRKDLAAKFARAQAAQVDAHLSEELNTTIANINAVRAAQGGSPLSPTTQALIDNESKMSDRERKLRVNNLKAEASEAEGAANYLRYSGKVAMGAARIGALSTVLKGASGAAYSMRPGA